MNLGGTVRVSRCGMLSMFGICALIIIYYVATNHQVKGSLAHTLKSQLHFKKSEDSLKFVDLSRLLAVAIEVAERGGNEVKQVRRDSELNLKSKGKTREGVINPVTDGDMRSHYQMYYGLKQMFPGLTVISEEHSHPDAAHPDLLPILAKNKEVEQMAITELDDPLALSDVTVWIDPLDATKEYSENKLEFVTTMVCVAVKGEPVIGVIHQPFKSDTGVTYWGWVERGHSKSLEIAPRSMDTGNKLPDPLKVLVSMSHAGETEELAKKAFGDSTVIVPAAGAGYKTLAALWGLGDVYLHKTLIKKWDTCAPNALLRATGGRMTTLTGDKIDYAAPAAGAKSERIEGGLLAAPLFHSQLLEKVKNANQA